MLTLEDLNDINLKSLITRYRIAQLNEDYEYEYGNDISKNDAISKTLESEHDLVNYLNKIIGN